MAGGWLPSAEVADRFSVPERSSRAAGSWNQ
jgi:hypothetical protein